MNNVTISILACIFLLLSFKLQANPIKCDSIVVTFMDGLWPAKDAQNTDSNEMGYFKCDLFLSGGNKRCDSLLLTTSMYAFMRPMDVTIKQHDGTSLEYRLSTPSEQMLRQEWIINQIGPTFSNINLSYGIEAISCYFYPSFMESNYPNIFMLDTNFGSWIPSSTEIDYSSCKINVLTDTPKKYLIFHSWKFIKESQPRFCITVVNRQQYHSHIYKIKNMEFHILTTKKEELFLGKFLNKLSNISLPCKIIKPISIIVVDWRGELENKEFAVGFGFNNYIMCDRTFMDDSSIIHEILHIFFPIIPDSRKGHLFISESVIEWLAHYIYYGKYQQSEYGDVLSKSDLPLYDIASNDKNNWLQIYTQGPMYLQRLADNVGAEKLYNTISTYYAEHDFVVYDEFIQYLIKSLGREAAVLDSAIKN